MAASLQTKAMPSLSRPKAREPSGRVCGTACNASQMLTEWDARKRQRANGARPSQLAPAHAAQVASRKAVVVRADGSFLGSSTNLVRPPTNPGSPDCYRVIEQSLLAEFFGAAHTACRS